MSNRNISLVAFTLIVLSFFVFTVSAVVCSSDLECNDNNSLTYDECINPATDASQCRNTPINCATNIDCGETGFIGSPFCSANDVLRNFQNASCMNPGTTNSFCIVEVDSRVIQMCTIQCSNGQCINEPTICGNGIIEQGEQCDDGNSNNNDACSNSCQTQTITCNTNTDCGQPVTTSDFCTSNNVTRSVSTPICNNPGTAQSFCSSTTTLQFVQQCSNFCSNGQCLNFACTQNSDCGVNTNSSNFCISNNVTTNSTVYVCNNPSTPQAFCSSSTTQTTVQQCSFMCSNSICINQTIACDEDIDCNDHDSETRDVCKNPGTTESFCKNIKIESSGSSHTNSSRYYSFSYIDKSPAFVPFAKSSNYTQDSNVIDLTSSSKSYEKKSINWILFLLIGIFILLVISIIVLLVRLA